MSFSCQHVAFTHSNTQKDITELKQKHLPRNRPLSLSVWRYTLDVKKETPESNVNRRQIMTHKVDPRTERVKYL